jgi:hypothetical protein
MIEVLETRQLLADGITPAAGAPITAAPGVPVTNAVFATYTVSDSSGAPGTQWRAKITFGDGQVAKNVLPVQVGSQFQFQGTHTYATAGNFTATVMIAVPGSHKPNDNTVSTPVTVTTSPTPTPSPTPSPTPTPSPSPTPTPPSTIGNFRSHGLKIQATKDLTYFGYVALFSEPNTDDQDFHAFIKWGDKSKVKPGHIHGRGNSQYAVLSQHRYGKTGVFHVSVQIRDGRGRKVTTSSLVRVIPRTS